MSPSPPTESAPDKVEISPAAIDLSCRWPVALFFGKGAVWAVLGVLLMLIASIKMHGPGFLADSAWLGLGRIKPAATNALVYGFAVQAGFGLLLWLLCRLGRTALLNASFLFLAGIAWNLGLLLGVVGILGGASTGHPYLELPRVTWPFFYVALGLIGLWGLLTFHGRQQRRLYVSQWFLVAGLFWLVWIASAASYLLVFSSLRGVMQSVVSAWYTHNLYHLWLTPVGLAALYYFVPKLLDRPLYSRQVALFGFWTLAFFAPWGGMTRLAGGPIPAWMISLSIATTFMMILPLGCAIWNLYMTAEGKITAARDSLVFRFLLAGSAAFILAWILQIATSFRTVSETTLFTFVPLAIDHLMLLGFFGLVAFGAIYYILPRTAGVNWPSEKLARVHFYGSAGGIAVHALGLLLAGWVLGVRLNHPEVEFMRALKSSIPMIGIGTLGLAVILVGQVAFLINVQKLICRSWMPWLAACCAPLGLAKTRNAEVEP